MCCLNGIVGEYVVLMGVRCVMMIDVGELSMGFVMVVGEVGWYVGWVVVFLL